INRTLIKRSRPVEYLNAGRYTNHKRKQRKDHAGHRSLSRNEHMVSPDKESNKGYSQRGNSNSPVSKNVLSAKGGNNFRDNTKAGDDHNVNGRVAVEPEKVLIEHWVAAQSRVKDSNAN